MTIKEAHKILHPDTTRKTLEEIRYRTGFKSREEEIKKVEEACTVACEALEKQIPKKPIEIITGDNEFICMICPSCQQVSVEFNDTYCAVCGQKLDWGD